MAENAARLSKAGLIDDAALAERMRRESAARAMAAGTAVPMASAPGLDGEPGAEHSDDPEQGDDVSPDGAGLLEDVTVAMAVELGRVTLSAADVVNLRAGQVIELSKHPGEPVDVVVDGRRIGKGELVEIDGELGVRILSISR
jgi:flagellar motor switch protein FliM